MAINELSRKGGTTTLLEKCRSIQWECSVEGCMEINFPERKAMLTRVWVQ